MEIDWRAVRVLTFDCYGTLVDWERGLLRAMRPLVPATIDDESLLAAFATDEAQIESGEYVCYREVLSRVADLLSKRLGFALPREQRGVIAESLVHWPLFDDTLDAIRALRTRVNVGIISNIDDDLAAAHFANVGLEVDWIVTAQSCGSYKPSGRNFEIAAARHRLGAGWVHVAQSIYHDIAPCNAAGIPSVWVDRRAGRSGGATKTASAAPDVILHGLQPLVSLIDAE